MARLTEKGLNGLFVRAHAGARKGFIVSIWRRVVAYALKGTAIAAAGVVAINEWPDINRWCGVAIFAAVSVDALFSNHKRLIARVRAGYAYKFLADRIHHEHNRKKDRLLTRLRRAQESGKDTLAIKQAIDKLDDRTYGEFFEAMSDIDKSLADVDVKALEALSLDNERAAAHAKQE